ncbi:MAG: histidine kinase, partial [Candidatus Omnitrophica bacterium]|nr:histidine kinase [Candidatus Omnitrophota bacterium]
MPKKKQDKTKNIISALTKISKVISSDLYLEDILKLIVTVTAEVMNSRICTLMLLDDKKQSVSIRATQSISEEYIKKEPL